MTARLGADAAEARSHVAAVADAWREIEENVLESGIVDQALKELCFGSLAGERIGAAGLGERERAALEWTEAIAEDADRADDALWTRLHALFSEPELVELGCAIGFELGRQHWRRSVGLPASR